MQNVVIAYSFYLLFLLQLYRKYAFFNSQNRIMNTKTIGDPSQFAIKYAFFDDSRETELSMIIKDNNILSFERNCYQLTTRWNLDDLALWLRTFVDNMADDPYPVEIEGEFTAIKDINAREFDSDDDDEFDAYYDKLDEWNKRHRWHTESAGAILADLYFQLVGEYVEVSWNNEDSEEDVIFDNILGGERVPKNIFISVVDAFLKEYALHWFN